MAESKPCLNCTRVKRPKDCNLKGCGAWKNWWIEKWDELRSKCFPGEERTEEDD